LIDMQLNRLILSLLFSSLLISPWGKGLSAAQDADQLSVEQRDEYFESKVLPILEEHCFQCHGGGDKVQAEFVLTNREDLLKGGESGEAIDMDDPTTSLFLEAINYESFEMPPDGKLPAEEIEILTRWVKLGVPWKGEGFKPDLSSHKQVPQVNDETKQWWSYQKVKPQTPPAVKQEAWVTNEIDRFILARLEEAHLVPAKPASRETLIRRAYYDLTGLPPTPQQVQTFVNDKSPDAYERLIDELLESPHYGEKWARHWLDLVRYAETNSYERDSPKPFVWKYRDYVINSFNADKPYDQFIREQIAGDELKTVTPESIIATGYYRLGIWDDEPVDQEQAWYDDMDDVLATTAQSFLGMTINCARCHDHKIDPIPQTDYYQMLAFFRNVQRYGVRGHDTVLIQSVRDIGSSEDKVQLAKMIEEYQQAIAANQAALEEIEKLVKPDFISVELEEFEHERNRLALVRKRVDKVIDQATFQQYKQLTEERNRLRREPPRPLEQALCVKERGAEAPETFVTIRGNAAARGDVVEPGFPQVLSPPQPLIEVPEHGQSAGRRLALANWLANADNPLTSRVMVNRIWQHHFGRGIVHSSNDFGFQGTPPTHPELLDWLANQFVTNGWRMKPLHKMLMLSSTYRMASRTDEQTIAADPLNELFSRFNMRRLTAEEVRDSILVMNGKLNDQLFGPSIYPVIPQEVLEGQSRPGADWNTSQGEDLNRRSVYIHVKRSLPVPLMANFDVADPDSSCPARFNTTQPSQALTMINSQYLHVQAQRFGDRLRSEYQGDVTAQVRAGLQLVLQREPAQSEIDRGLNLIKTLQEKDKLSADKSLDYFCLVALNLNEFIYLD
jgi:mono/diheme cytochrome c family protein